MLAETIDVAKRAKLATDESLVEVFVDTNVQTKAIPTKVHIAKITFFDEA